jgi:transposase InsO family protein
MAQIKQFLQGGGGISFAGKSRDETYRWMEMILSRFWYFSLRKKEKTVIRRYIMKMTGYSDSHLTRLIKKKKETRVIRAVTGKRHTFEKQYTPEDVALLIKTDTAHGRLSGKATKKILERECAVYGKKEYERLSRISSSHVYNLRVTRQYESVLGSSFEKTKPTATPIGQRRKPEPDGKPGYIRVDTVHQGDCVGENGNAGKKGVYHINLVDEVLQWEIAGSIEGISERFLAPLLEQMIKQFPFRVINFHSDNGSEYINRIVAALLNKMMIGQTKSRPRHSNDNGLAETKNGSVIRKHFGYAYIEQRHAKPINQFYRTYMNPYLNFHRPSGFATRVLDTKKPGKYKNVYNTYLTPFEKLQSLERPEQYLKPGMTMALLEQFSKQLSDTEAAEQMQKAKRELFKSFRREQDTTG